MKEKVLTIQAELTSKGIRRLEALESRDLEEVQTSGGIDKYTLMDLAHRSLLEFIKENGYLPLNMSPNQAFTLARELGWFEITGTLEEVDIEE